jgi:N-acetylglucosamine-6-phosphate deacetylase
MDLAITAGTLYTPTEQVVRPIVCMQDGVVASIDSAESREVPGNTRVLDLGDAMLVPGYIDMHIHGGAGHDVMETGGDALPAVEKLLHAHGVTTYFPTTVTAPMDRTLRALEHLATAIEKARASSEEDRARPVGIHLEGPFISHARPGVHPPADLLKPSLAAFEKFWEASRGTIKIITIAPELEGARAVISEASRRGVCVSMGHSDANLQQAQDGVAAGVRHATHTFNAMRPLEHRDPGIIAEALMDDRVSAEIIADGIHVDPLMVQLFLRVKGAEGAVLVTDATAATGMPNGRYHLGSLEVEVKDGKVLHGGKLAGSVLTMDQAVRNIVKFANWKLPEAVRLATMNPARASGLAAGTGTVAPGAPADIVALTPAGEVMKTIVRGRVA